MTNMFSVYSGMFRTQPACSSLTTLDLSNWDTSNVTSMSGMFNGMTHLQQVTFGSNWKWVGTNGYLPTPSNTYISGADGKWYDTDGNGYAPADIPTGKAATYYASKDLLPKAFAVYSDDDQSLNFYKRSGVPAVGDTFEGKKVTAVYTGIEEKPTTQYPQWKDKASKIKTAVVVDNGIKPVSTAHWFDAGYRNLATVAIAKLDTSSVTDMNSMFEDCYNLTSVDGLSSWDTSNVTNMNSMFYGCSRLNVDCSNWDVGSQKYSSSFNYGAPGVVLPLAWQTSSDEGDKDSTIAPLCEEQENRDALSVSDENSNDEAVSKTDGEASADSETVGSNTASADDAGAKEEEASGDIVQEETAAA